MANTVKIRVRRKGIVSGDLRTISTFRRVFSLIADIKTVSIVDIIKEKGI